jgi:hypothetical protein
MTKTAAEVEREVEESRGALDRTVEALKDKMTPGQLLDEATRTMGGAGQQILSKFVEQAKENPMPLAVMGLGLAWLMTSNRQSQPRPSYSYRDAYVEDYERGSYGAERSGAEGRGLGEKVGEKVQAVGEKASEIVSGGRERLAGGAASAREAGRAATQRLSTAAHSATDLLGEYGSRAGRSFTDTLERDPLVIGALGAVVGVALGSAIPATSAEDRMVGPIRDKVLEKGKGMAHEGMERAGDVAEAVYSTVKSELQASPDDDRDLTQRAQDAAREAVQAGREELRPPPQ